MNTYHIDFLIIGSGVAGLSAALQAAKYGKVALVTKSNLKVSSSNWAQGGIAAVLDSGDTFQSHILDTLEAGRGNNNRAAVEVLVREGSLRVKELIREGMPFDKQNDQLVRSLEGGHSKRRILHSGGAATGQALVQFLLKRVQENDAIECFEKMFVYQLLIGSGRCSGAAALCVDTDESVQFCSRHTVLASGGYSGLFRRSTNPHTSTGDGLWLAFQAGANLADLEFMQFHPTAFYDGSGSSFLISEAVRGEGARLVNKEGIRFLQDHPQQELAPRDVVAHAIFNQMHRYGEPCVYLDTTHLKKHAMENHFPGIAQKLAQHDLHFSDDLIPVAPAAHYSIGGVVTDMNGQTCIDGLYACGEVASNGVHGANRLASNSLLECLVFSHRAIEHASQQNVSEPPLIAGPNLAVNTSLRSSFKALKNKVADILSDKAGIIRSEELLQQALKDLDQLELDEDRAPQNEYYTLRGRQLSGIARKIAASARKRTESRGVHIRSDYPDQASEPYQLIYASGQGPSQYWLKKESQQV